MGTTTTYEDAFTHTVQIGDDRLRVELSADCTPSPGYEVLAARARVFSDDAALTTAGGSRNWRAPGGSVASPDA
jgi:hypothetical protein